MPGHWLAMNATNSKTTFQRTADRRAGIQVAGNLDHGNGTEKC